MKILLLGHSGQVGWELYRTLLTLGKLTALDYPTIDMANPDNIRRAVHEAQPDLIVNATAYTDVDKAESEPDLAMAVNATGPGILAEEAHKRKAALIHYSTDYVFDGTKGEPYTEEDEPKPLNVYGETKLAGERAIQAVGGAYLVFRTSWVYSMRRPSFLSKVLIWARKHETMRIVDDQISSPTWARAIAEATAQMIAQGKDNPVNYIMQKRGLFHLAGGGSCSRLEWAKAIIDNDPNKHEQIVHEILPAKSEDFPSPALRPRYTVLNNSTFEQTFYLLCPDWELSLATCLNDLGN